MTASAALLLFIQTLHPGACDDERLATDSPLVDRDYRVTLPVAERPVSGLRVAMTRCALSRPARGSVPRGRVCGRGNPESLHRAFPADPGASRFAPEDRL